MHATLGFEIHEALKEFLYFLEKQDGSDQATATATATISNKTTTTTSGLGKFTAHNGSKMQRK